MTIAATRRRAVVIAIAGAAALASGAWGLTVAWRGRVGDAAPPAGPGPASARAERSADRGGAAAEPELPPPGTPDRTALLDAWTAGEQRALTELRKALRAAAAGGGADRAYVQRLEAMERVHAARLDHHAGAAR
jgi:hypothetical protein